MKPCELYRHFDKDGRLLYVGIAWTAWERLKGHRSFAAWFDQITRIEIERFPSRADAMRAENMAIEAEKPIFNIASKRKRGLACLSEEENAERKKLIDRAEGFGLRVRKNSCLNLLTAVVRAAEAGDMKEARFATGLTQR